MNNQVKFRKLKVHRKNSQTMLYHVRFSTDTVHNSNIFFFLFFGFLLFFCFFFSFFAFCLCFFFKQKICILVHIRLWGRVSDKKNSPGQILKTRQLFWPNLRYAIFHFSIGSPHQHKILGPSKLIFLKILLPPIWRGACHKGLVAQKFLLIIQFCVNVLASNN